MLTTTTFEWVDLPEGPQPLPDWLKGAHAHWCDGYANPPTLRLKTEGNAREWEGKVWKLFGQERYTAQHPDGRSQSYYHRGAVSRVTLQRRRSDGEPGVEPYEAWATEPYEGLGGSHVHCLMAPGEKHAGEVVVLRGPWCSLPAPGFVDVSFTDVTHSSFAYGPGRPWHERGGIAGLCISEDLFLRAVARFLPHVRVARTLPYRTSPPVLQLVRPDWDVPKTVAEHRRAEAYKATRAERLESVGGPR